MTIEQLDPEKVKDNPYQPRKGYSPGKVAEIASSIEQNGLLSTPLGRRQNGDIQLAFGHVRRRAFVKLKKKSPKKWPTMPVEIREITDQQMAVYALEENLKRSDITPIDLARSVTRYFEVFPDATETELAKKLSMTQGNVSNMRRVMRLQDEILAKIDEGRIFFTMARELLIFEGLKAPGKDSRYNKKKGGYVDIPKDAKWLMLDAIKRIAVVGKDERYDSLPRTVDGMQKAIHKTVGHNFCPLGTGTNYPPRYGVDDVLFDIDKAGCKSCESMIKTHPTKSQVCRWCTKPKCWEKHQKDHIDRTAAEAKKQMEKDILARTADAETKRQAEQGISREIPPAGADIIDSIPEEEREAARVRIQSLGKTHPDYPCITCLSVGRCDGTGVHAVDVDGKKESELVCDNRMGKADAKKVREKATLEVPPELNQLAREKAGSRAEVLDLNEIGTGSYGYLKQGYVLLDSVLDTMDKPEECLETCIKGFHYAFNSKPQPSWRTEDEDKVKHVCTDPKCVSRKKAAYTRALHAAGMAKKKAEASAIKEAVTSTTILDRPRLKVIIAAFFVSSRSYYSYNNEAINWFAERLKVGKKDVSDNYGHVDSDKLRAKVLKHLDSVPEEELTKVVLQYAFSQLTYDGDIKDYKITTTEALNWLGIGINLPKGGKGEAAADN